MSTVEVGTVVAERYRLERRMSEGGIGSLWCAQDLRAGHACAVRLGDGAAGSREEILDRFRAEAEAVAAIRCTNVLDVYDYGEHEGLPFLVTEHVEGEDLGARLRREGRLQPSVAYGLAVQIAKALSRAHAANIVHGDLKPEHVLLVEAEGRSTAKVFNFNLTQRAREVGVADATRLGSFLSLPYYSSPEQIGRKPADGRSDLWSLGVMVYECLTGKRPFDSAVFGDLVALIVYEPVPALEVPGVASGEALGAWWTRACARPPSDRFASAKAMVDELGLALGLPAVDATETSVPSVPAAAAAAPTAMTASAPLRKVARHGTQIGLGLSPVVAGAPAATPLPPGGASTPAAPMGRVGSVGLGGGGKVTRHKTQIGLGLAPQNRLPPLTPPPPKNDSVTKALKASAPSRPGSDPFADGLWTTVPSSAPAAVPAPSPASLRSEQLQPTAGRPHPSPGFDQDLMSEVEWPEPSSRAPQSPTTEPGAELPGDAGAIPAHVAATEDSAASQIQPELTEEAPTEAVGMSEAVLEGAVEGADDDELEEVESDDDAESETASSAGVEGYGPWAGSAAGPQASPGQAAPSSATTVAELFVRHKVLWILAAFVAGCVLMTLHILLPSPTATVEPRTDAPASAKEADPPDPSHDISFDADEAAKATAADLTTP